MNLGFEMEVAQNPAIGAVALWQFCRAYFDEVGGTEGPELPKALIVLPMVLHSRTASAIYRMQSASGLLKALRENPEIPAGLQERLESMATLSLDALAVALSTGLLAFDRDEPWPRYHPVRKSLPAEIAPTSDDARRIVAASQRLGCWFARDELDVLCDRLHLRI